MCAIGSSATTGVGTDRRLAIGQGTTLGGAAGGAAFQGVRETVLGGAQRTQAGGAQAGAPSGGTRPRARNQPY